MGETAFRPYRSGDLRACAKHAAEAWPVASAVVPESDVPRLMAAYVESARLYSTWQEVVSISGVVRGLLFGQIPSDVSRLWAARAGVASLALGLRVALRRYGQIARPRTFLQQVMATDRQVEKHMPREAAIVELFVVDASARGQGLGRALMDRFVDAARAKGARSVGVYTDPLSSWQFYERVGFRRVAEFEDPLNSYMTGQAMQSFVYVKTM